ncbi:hypothetical protein U1Q18_015133 [Sarracenia purpurea var. burkii]
MAILSNAAVAGRCWASGLGRLLRKASRRGLLLNIHRSPPRGAWDLLGLPVGSPALAIESGEGPPAGMPMWREEVGATHDGPVECRR